MSADSFLLLVPANVSNFRIDDGWSFDLSGKATLKVLS